MFTQYPGSDQKSTKTTDLSCHGLAYIEDQPSEVLSFPKLRFDLRCRPICSSHGWQFKLSLKLLLYIKGRSRAGKRLTAWKFSQEAQGGHDGLIGVVGV